MTTGTSYDVVIIGAGMAGLAAGIRLAHFGKKVCILERHNAVGGLNGFYSIAGRKYDVGLHAVTNYVTPGVKGTPLGKLLRQLRIDRDEWALSPQKQSKIIFGPAGEQVLRFSNDFALLESEVASRFPREIDGFRALAAEVRAFDDVSLTAQPVSAREIVRRHIKDPLLEAMLFCPVMYYGSAQEHDMEFGQFVIMFKALYLEGFARPLEGVRVILRVLLEKYRQAGGERRMKCGVKRIVLENGRAVGVELDSGEYIGAKEVLSSAGGPETAALLGDQGASAPRPGNLSYVETISVLRQPPAAYGWGDDTILFFNDSERFSYAAPKAPWDARSGVICFPNNFAYPDGAQLEEGWWRCTCLARYDAWKQYSKDEYAAVKAKAFRDIQASARRFLPPIDDAVLEDATVARDMFTPLTVERFTGHQRGAIYGSPDKNRQGRTSVPNVYLCGTDQGFLGIIGAMLSGISMANYHILQKG